MELKLKKKEKTLEEEYANTLKEAVELYKKLNGLEKLPIEEKDFFPATASDVANVYPIRIDDLKEALMKHEDLNEDTEAQISDKIEQTSDATPEQADAAAEVTKDIQKKADTMDIEFEELYVEGDIEKQLNACYKSALQGLKEYSKFGTVDKEKFNNILLEGDVGIGKTERVKSWAKHKGIKCVVMASGQITMDDIKSIPVGEDPDHPGRAKTVTLSTFDELDIEPCILFIDEFNRYDTQKRTLIMKFIDEHSLVQDTAKNGTRYFSNLLFTVAAINPYVIDAETNETDDDEGVYGLTSAELNRFLYHPKLDQNAKDFLNYEHTFILKKLKRDTQMFPENAEENAGKAAIANALFDSVVFTFATRQQIKAAKARGRTALTPRTLVGYLMRCDGTKEDFLYPMRDALVDTEYKKLEAILSEYKDVNDITNDVWKFWAEHGVKKPKELEDDDDQEKVVSTIKKHSSMLSANNRNAAKLRK